MKIKYFDSHSHLNFSQYDEDRERVILDMKKEGVATICVGTDAKTSREVVDLAEAHENIYAIVGLHPTDSSEGFDYKYYEGLSKNKSVVGVGECGLDYFRIEAEDKGAREEQKEVFKKQIEFALDMDLPLMLHIRSTRESQDAYRDALEILETYSTRYGDKLRGTSHFFAGNKNIAARFLELGFAISFAGPITFAGEYRPVIASVPIDMILAETDAPFASPSPHRGKRNEPIFVKHVVETISEIKNKPLEEVREVLVDNVERVFRARS